MSFAPVISVLGWLLALFAAAMLAPVAVSLAYGEPEAAAAFAATAAVTLFFGIGLVIATRGAERRIARRGNFLIAVVAWPLLALFGAAPLLLLDAVATPTDAFFETLSGLTTTGATVMSGLEGRARGIVFWRAGLQWLGGLGTIVLAVSVLPMLGAGGMQAFQSAMPHGDHVTLEARTVRSAATLSWIYAGLTLMCAAALALAGMPAFDALGHALSTVSTGGFSTRDGGLAAFGSPSVEWVLIVFMLAGAMNFTLYGAVLRGRASVFRHDPECRAMFAVAALAALAAAYALARHGPLDGGEALRQGVFATVSMLTTTGFVGAVESWPTSLPLLFLALMLVGGSSGSTAGGIKFIRLTLAMKQGARELARLSHPHGVARLHYGERPVTAPTIQALWSFFILFFVGLAALAIGLAALGLDPRDAVAMALATLTNAGAGLALVAGPEASYAVLPDAAKWLLCAGMLLGRLEFVMVVALLSPMFWRR